jgi:hypothetical protein
MAGKEVSADELCKSLIIRYGKNPIDLQPSRDGCGMAL